MEPTELSNFACDTLLKELLEAFGRFEKMFAEASEMFTKVLPQNIQEQMEKVRLFYSTLSAAVDKFTKRLTTMERTEEEVAEIQKLLSETEEKKEMLRSILEDYKLERIAQVTEEYGALKDESGKEIDNIETLNAPKQEMIHQLRAKLCHVKNLFENVHKYTIAICIIFDDEQSITLIQIPKDIKRIAADLDVREAQSCSTRDDFLSFLNYRKSTAKAIAKLEKAIEKSLKAYETGKFKAFSEYNFTVHDVNTTLNEILIHSNIMQKWIQMDGMRKRSIELLSIDDVNKQAFGELHELLQRAALIQENLLEYKRLDSTSDEQKIQYHQRVAAVNEYEKRFEKIEAEITKERKKMSLKEVLLKRIKDNLKLRSADSERLREKVVYYSRYFDACHKAWKVDYLKKEAFLLLSLLKSVGVLFNIAVEGYVDIATDMEKHDVNGDIDTFEDKFQALKNYDCDTLRQMSLEIIFRLELFRTDAGLLKNAIEQRIDYLLQSIDNVEWTPQSEPKGKGKKVKQKYTNQARGKAYNQLKGRVKSDLENIKSEIADTKDPNDLREVLYIDLPPIYEKYRDLTRTLK